MSGPERLDDDSIATSLESVLERYPDAGIAAVGPDGIFVEMPDAVPRRDQRVLTERAGIELVGPSDRAAVLQQFLRLPEVGASELNVTARDGRPATYFLFDTVDRYGVVVLVFVAEGEPLDDSVTVPEAAPVRPRYARIWRTELGEVLRIDDAVTAILGNTLEDYRAGSSTHFIHADDHENMITNWFDVIGSPRGTTRRWRGRCLRNDGSWVWMEITNTNHLDDPDEPHILSELVDISAEMRAADEVWESRELLRRLTDALPVGVVQFDRNGAVQYANDRLHELLGTEGDGDLYASITAVPEADRRTLVESVTAVLAGEDDVDIEIELEQPGPAPSRVLQLALRSLKDRDEQVTGAIVTVTDVTEATRLREELQVKATYDTLTGCHNRASILAELGAAIASQGSAGGPAVIFADLDGFKAVNDRAGHGTGDQVLQLAAERLRGAVRSRDLVGRVGGDEFVVVCPDVTSAELAMDVAHRIAGAITGPVLVDGFEVPLSVSVGVAWMGDARVDADELVAVADAAMYVSKREGEGRPVLAAMDDRSGVV